MTSLNDLQQIREFVQIADSGSISAAAKILGMAQPTLSRHLAALETQIGAPLIRRDTHTMSLAEAGRLMEESTAALGPEERADGFRALARGLANQLGRLEVDDAHPELAPFNLWRQKFYMDNPEFRYWVAEISGEVTLGTFSTKVKASYEVVPKKCKALGDASQPASIAAAEPDEAPGIQRIARPGARPASPRPQGDSSGGLCATVRLQLDQEAVLTRNAFNATLELSNNDPAAPIENVEVLLSITDADGANVDERFGIRSPNLTNLSAVDGTGRLPAAATGSASWILIPTRDAAPETRSKRYRVAVVEPIG